MAESEVLTRDKAIPENILPTGRKLGIVPVKTGHGLYEITYTDGKGGVVPNDLVGRFTGTRWAQDALNRFLEEMWDMSDKASKKKDAVSR